MLFTTKDLYGTDDMSFLEGEIPYIEARIIKLETRKVEENNKHWSDRDDHLITKINQSQDYWGKRKDEIEKSLKRKDNGT